MEVVGDVMDVKEKRNVVECFLIDRMAKSAKINRYNVWIPVLAALAIWLMGVSPVYIILIAGIGGYTYGQYFREN